MISSPIVLVAALVLLWCPRRWMRLGTAVAGGRRSRSAQETWKRSDQRLRFSTEAVQPRNWFDLLRGAAGSLAVFGGHGIEPSIARVADEPRSGLVVVTVQAGIVLTGLLIQLWRQEGRHAAFFAPVFYLAGLSVGLCGGWAAFFAFVLAWAVNSMLPHAMAFLLVQGVALAAFGIWLRGMGNVRPVMACLLCLTPALLSLLLRRPLVVFSRPARGGDR